MKTKNNDLKHAILELGPSGFGFEKFCAALLEKMGFEVELNQKVEGRCVEHEIDVLARKGSSTTFVECKFRNNDEFLIDLKTALYLFGRAHDLNALDPIKTGVNFWVMTNAKLAPETEKYIKASGLCVFAWDYGLQELIEKQFPKNYWEKVIPKFKTR